MKTIRGEAEEALESIFWGLDKATAKEVIKIAPRFSKEMRFIKKTNKNKEMFERLDEIREVDLKLKRVIKEEEERICDYKLKELNLSIGDTVLYDGRKGILDSISILGKYLFDFSVLAINKDGTAGENNIYLGSDIDELIKEKND